MGAHVRLTRSGGIAGLDMVASVDVDDLPAETAAPLRSALAGLASEAEADTGPVVLVPAAGADRYQYDLAVTDGAKRWSVTAHEGALTPAVRAVVDLLLPFASPR